MLCSDPAVCAASQLMACANRTQRLRRQSKEELNSMHSGNCQTHANEFSPDGACCSSPGFPPLVHFAHSHIERQPQLTRNGVR